MSENDLAGKIRDLRAKHGLTLEQVAQQVGVGRSTVRKWETGLIANMRRDKIEKLAKALHTTPGYLMGWENSDDVSPTSPSDGILVKTQPPANPVPSLILDPIEEEIVRKYRALDERGQSAVLNVLNYEYDSLPGEKTDSPAKEA